MKKIDKKLLGLAETDLANVFTTYQDDDGNYVFNMCKTVEFENIDNYNNNYIDQYEVKTGDTYYKISYDYYNTTRLWWVICRANNIANPLTDLVGGTVISVPKLTIVNKILDSIKN
jgi:nucleoid-associated protein YgaU